MPVPQMLPLYVLAFCCFVFGFGYFAAFVIGKIAAVYYTAKYNSICREIVLAYKTLKALEKQEKEGSK